MSSAVARGFQVMRIRCVQEEMKRMFYERDRERGLYATFTWLVEEVGELAEALLSGDRKKIAEELADVLAWTLSIANLVEIDAEKALAEKYGLETCKRG